jgi:hypothetical protein
LELFDAVGNKVKILVTGEQKEGRHQVTVESKLLDPGFYFYSLKTLDTIVTKRMMVLK